MLDTELQNVKNICIIGHVNPDGDCIGSALAVYNYILSNYSDKSVKFYSKNYNEKFSFLNGFKNIDENDNEQIIYDLAISVDCASSDRLGDFLPYYKNAKRKIIFDHHETNNLISDNSIILPKMTSTAEVIYGDLDKQKINKQVAECIFTGLIHDTGVFRYPSVTAETFECAAFLIGFGINHSKIIEDSYYSVSLNQQKITAEVILNSKLAFNNKIIYSTLTNDQMKKYKLDKKDIDGIIAHLRETSGIIGAFFIYQSGANEYKVSMRSKSEKFDVSKLAQKFNGGGHILASGCTIESNTPDIFYMFEDEISKMLS